MLHITLQSTSEGKWLFSLLQPAPLHPRLPLPSPESHQIKSRRDLLLLFPSRLHFKGANVRGERAGGRRVPRGRRLGLPQVLALPGCPGVTFHPEQPPKTPRSS